MTKHGSMDESKDYITCSYELEVPRETWKRQFTEEEKRILRPMAETLAMLDGNAFFTIPGGASNNSWEWYEQYLPEAYQVFEQNGGLTGWAGEASWIRDIRHETPAVREAYENFRILRELSRGDSNAEDNG